MGRKLFFKPMVPIPWASSAPAIAGLFNYSDEEAIKFMEMGERKTGPVRPPTPEFRLNHAAAGDVVAYRRSLGPK